MYLDQASGLVLPQRTQLASDGRRIGAYFLSPLLWRPKTNSVPGFWYMALREIVGRFIDGILGIITGITSFVLFVASKDHKALHDQIAGTVVLYDPDKVLAS
jgi:RDD family